MLGGYKSKRFLDQANAALERKRWNAAIDAAQHVAQMDPECEQAYLIMGIAHFQQKQYDEAFAAYKRALQINPQNAIACFNLSQVCMKIRDWATACVLTERLCEMQSENKRHRERLKALYYRTGQTEKALGLEREDRGGSLPEDSRTGLHAMVENVTDAIHRRDWEKAYNEAHKVFQLDPDNFIVGLHLGASAYHLKRFDEAINIYSALIRKNPDHRLTPVAQNNLARTYLRLKEWSKAGEILERLTSLDVEQLATYTGGLIKPEEVLANLGLTYEKRNMMKMAQLTYEKLVKSGKASAKIEERLRQLKVPLAARREVEVEEDEDYDEDKLLAEFAPAPVSPEFAVQLEKAKFDPPTATSEDEDVPEDAQELVTDEDELLQEMFDGSGGAVVKSTDEQLAPNGRQARVQAASPAEPEAIQPQPSAAETSLKCPGCDAELATNAQFCPSCGTKIDHSPPPPPPTQPAPPSPRAKTANAPPEPIKCIKCGTIIPTQAAFCPSCGSPKPPEDIICFCCETPNRRSAVRCSFCGSPLIVCDSFPQELRQHYYHVQELIRNGDPNEAAEEFSKIVVALPNSSMARFGLGVLHELCRAPDAAARQYVEVFENAEREPEIACAAAIRHAVLLILPLRKPSEAIAFLEKAIRKFPQNSHLHYLRGFAFARMSEHAKAGRCFNKVLEINPQHALAYSGLAEVNNRQGKSDEAARFISRAIFVLTKLEISQSGIDWPAASPGTGEDDQSEMLP
ncbi:MAG TPA: tetratricopeptide repeat protein [Candidatus Brocadiia bacterium]|nr:tetratricopeptide repeat protein [Candidatus Brocadiia bacterium]